MSYPSRTLIRARIGFDLLSLLVCLVGFSGWCSLAQTRSYDAEASDQDSNVCQVQFRSISRELRPRSLEIHRQQLQIDQHMHFLIPAVLVSSNSFWYSDDYTKFSLFLGPICFPFLRMTIVSSTIAVLRILEESARPGINFWKHTRVLKNRINKSLSIGIGQSLNWRKLSSDERIPSSFRWWPRISAFVIKRLPPSIRR